MALGSFCLYGVGLCHCVIVPTKTHTRENCVLKKTVWLWAGGQVPAIPKENNQYKTKLRLRSCVKLEGGWLSWARQLLMVSVDVKQHGTELKLNCVKVDLAVPNSPYGLGGRKATWNSNNSTESQAELCES